MANELAGFSKFLKATLAGDTATAALVSNRIYEDLAPQGTTYPFLVFGINQATDLNGIGAVDARIFTIPVYYVRAVVQDESYSIADQVAAVVDTALQGAEGTALIGSVTYQIRGVFRTSPVRFPENAGGLQYRHSGGLYKAFVHT